MQEAESEEKVETAAESREEAVDASASIISNFAKIFAKGKDSAEKTQDNTNQTITAMGDGNKTLESFVEEAVIRVIGKDIAKEWNNGADYRNMAEAEIKLQVKAWIDNNMPSMIEDIVKSEIERVIAKVGSQS